MKAHELKTLLSNLLNEADASNTIATTAKKNRKSISGNGSYAHRFHQAIVSLTGSEKKIRPHLDGLQLPPSSVSEFDHCLAMLKDPATKSKDRITAVRGLQMACETVIIPKAEALTASPIPSTESVLPLAVVQGTRGYLEKIVTQINGCYEHQWYDACSVMIRKLAEILIIAVYEEKGVPAEIKGADGHFFLLSGLIDQIRRKSSWNLGRETLPCLEKMKELGDRSAHNRHYVATRPDVDKLISGLRVTVEDLLNHAGLR